MERKVKVKKLNSLCNGSLRKVSGTGGKIVYVIGQALVLIWVMLTLVMLLWVILASLHSTKDIFQNNLLSGAVTAKGYQQVFAQYKMGLYFFNSIVYTGVACAGLVLFCAPAAFVLAQFKFRGRKLFDIMFSSALGLPSVMLLAPLLMSIIRLKISESIWTLCVLYIGIGIPYTVVFLISFFSSLPMSVFESALIDGASHMKAFWRVMLPMAQPGIITVTIYNFITYWNEYIWALTIANDDSRKSLAVGLQSVVQGMGNTGNYTGLFAAVVVVFVPTLVLYLLLSEKIIGSVTSGAVKG